jgi:hypothetical protein
MRNRTGGMTITVSFLLIVAACTQMNVPETISPMPTHSTDTNTPVPPSETPTSTPTLTPVPTHTPTRTPIPTYEILRGNVIPERLSCRFGPKFLLGER